MELLVVVSIIAILSALLFQGVKSSLRSAEAAKNTEHLKQILVGTITWSMDNGDRLPSPQYPGGMEVPPGQSAEDFYPKYWDWGTTGLWLDGPVFGALYLAEAEEFQAGRDEDGEEGGGGAGYSFSENGDHLKGTFFESTISVKKNRDEEDWHRHSYAMNKNLQYNRIYDSSSSSDPWLTEKNRANLVMAPKAMIYIDCIEQNVVSFEDRELIIDTIEERWDGKKLIAAFLDGHMERLAESEIPEEDPNTDRQSSHFWRGVDTDP